MTVNADGSGIRCNSLAVSGGKTEMYCSGKKYGALIYGDESAISIAGCTVKLTGEEGAIKFTAEGDSDPFNGSLPKATFKGNTAVNTFAPLQEVNYKSEKGPVTNTYNEYAYVGNDMAKSLAVIHTHNPVKIVGKPATKNESGWKDYYQCKDSFDACGEYFEDAAGLIMIDDLEEWKAPGGNGHLPKSDDPKPGDNGDIFLWITVLAASLAGIVICLTLAKKRIRNN